MKIGQLVMLIGTDGYTPPFGTIGTIVSNIDDMNDYEVFFEDHPCPVEDPIWFRHISWLLPLYPNTDSFLEYGVNHAINKINLVQQ